jgi:urease beta subunit
MEQQQCAGRHFHHTALNFVLSFLRIVTLGGKLQNIFMSGLNLLFSEQDSLAFGLLQ